NEKFFIETASSWKGGLSTLTAYLKEYPETGLVIIDTLFMFAPIADTNKYSDTYSPVSAIQRLATEKEIPIVLIHHTRKGAKGDTGEAWADEGMGSQGINGACDTIVLLKKPDGKSDGTIRIKGRDVEEACFNVIFDKDICTWRITGEGEIVKADTQARSEVISVLEKAGPQGMKTGEIAAALGKEINAISNLLRTLQNMGRVKNISYGK
ncbi:MAG: helicase RepA family protein, partial [Treponema sp.]|nr:helicase RepA family protein [Treponema sp.]